MRRGRAHGLQHPSTSRLALSVKVEKQLEDRLQMEAAAEVAALHEAKETTRKDDPAKSALDGLPLTSGPLPTSGAAMARGAFVAGCLEGARHLLRQFMV